MDVDIRSQILAGVWLVGLVVPPVLGFPQVGACFLAAFVGLGSLVMVLRSVSR